MIDDKIGHNSAYVNLNLIDDLDYCLGGYGKPTVEFLFSLNTFVETFIASSEFYTSLDELNHLNLTTPVLFPNGRPILNLIARHGGLKFVNGIVDNPGSEIYRGNILVRSKREAQQDFVLEYGQKIQEKYFIKNDINLVLETIPLATSKFEDDCFVVSETQNSLDELVSNLMNVSRSSSIQTSLPLSLYGKQIRSLNRTPYSIQSLEMVAKIHNAKVEDLKSSLNYQYLPIPSFTNILLSSVTSVSEIPHKLGQLRLDFQELRDQFVQLEIDINESATMKQQLEAFRKFKDFWNIFNNKYVESKHRIMYGDFDFTTNSDLDKGIDTFIDGSTFTDSVKDLNFGKILGNVITKGYSWYSDRKVINRFKGITNIWELFENSNAINQQLKHFERLFGVNFTNSEINNVHDFVSQKLNNITKEINN
ncbi:hypothetical protein PGH12_06860 [Chryseobacterium wangxinyae]|uniref:hypothetical protein n=1 Tax=Chryseobacterium sp. CY350 TaxID=2997336 RepID=UPI00226F9495|nr:hypothetical protein [Chryseobacterium sp. CY350]MCY0976871.1 hypothetical protein [Chryseobacterium sp. CY350]WBZ96870.1 hypothetical protein PGH12_06860 [Chryseobacterium sp. CY350]